RAYPDSGSVRSEQRRRGRKEPPPAGLRGIWPGASLLVGHSPTAGGCSLLAPRPRPNGAQQTSPDLRPRPLSLYTKETKETKNFVPRPASTFQHPTRYLPAPISSLP